MEVSTEDRQQEMKTVYEEIMKRAPEHSPQPSLERIAYILDLLGHPEQSFHVVQITGTNGKGSTSKLTEALIRSYGLRTGLYTSPHLEKVNERISIDGESISDDTFIDTYKQIKDYINLTDQHFAPINGTKMSFFEVLTTMAICAFADAPVDIAVMEVGMGGRWDATNILTADVAIIGPIDMDHMQWLGNTLEDIATEKAGIIKDNTTVIVGPQKTESVYNIIAEAATQKHNTHLLRDGEELEVISRLPAVGGQVATLKTPLGTYTDVPIKMFGEHQSHNALAALAACEAILPINGVLDGQILADAFSTVNIPGRIEVIRNSPTVILDGAHNPHAIEHLVTAINENFAFKNIVGVVSMMKDKQVETVLSILEPIFTQIVVTQNSNIGRVMPVEELAEIAKDVFGEDRVIVEPLLPNAIQTAVNNADVLDDTGLGYGCGVVITGSFVTVGDARMLLKHEQNKMLLKPKDQRVS